jgi:predicted Fe-Mo cluster-binding NifX family protein
MRLCIPTDSNRGLDAAISGHFGSAPYFTLVESDTGSVEVVSNRHAHHAPGTCEAARGLPAHGVGAVVCLGLGRRALDGLRQIGIEVFVTEAGYARAALEAFRSGCVMALSSEEACRGGRHQCEEP